MGFQQWTERNVGTIALFTAIAALVVSICACLRPMPCAKKTSVCFWEGCPPTTPACPKCPSPEMMQKLNDRIALLDQQIKGMEEAQKNGQTIDPEELYAMRLERDLARLFRHSLKTKRPIQWNALPALLNTRWHAAVAKLRETEHQTGLIGDDALCRARLAANTAELAWLNAWDRLANRQAFQQKMTALQDYPAVPADEETLILLYDLGDAPDLDADAPAPETPGKPASAPAASPEPGTAAKPAAPAPGTH